MKRNLIPEVKAMVERPFEEKWLETLGIVARNIADYRGRTAVAFSGGKDSAVTLHIVRQLEPDVLVIHNDTGVEWPQTQVYIGELCGLWELNFHETKPAKTFWDCAREYGFPRQTKRSRKAKGGRTAPRCCYHLKERPMQLAIREKGIGCYFSGETAEESYSRMFWARDRGMCFEYVKWQVQKVKPILWWTVEEVWDYATNFDLPMNSLYSEGAERVGCLPCTAYMGWEDQLRRLNPKMWRIIKQRIGEPYQDILV